MQFKDEAIRLADDSHLPGIDPRRVLAGGKRRLRRRRIAVGSVSLVAVVAVGIGGYSVAQGLLRDGGQRVPATPLPAASPTPSATPSLRAAGEACVAPFTWDSLLEGNVGSIDGAASARVVHIADDGSTVVETLSDDGTRATLRWFPTTELADGTAFHEIDRGQGGGLNGIDRAGDQYVFNTSRADGTSQVLAWSPGDAEARELFEAADVLNPVAVAGDSLFFLEQGTLKRRPVEGGDESVVAKEVRQFRRDGVTLVLMTEDRGVRVLDLGTLDEQAAPGPLAELAADTVAARDGVWAWSDEQDGTFGAWTGEWDGALTTGMDEDRAYAASQPQVAGDLVVLTDHRSVESVGSIWDLRTNAVSTLPDGYVAEGHGEFVVVYRAVGYERELVGIHPVAPLEALTCG